MIIAVIQDLRSDLISDFKSAVQYTKHFIYHFKLPSVYVCANKFPPPHSEMKYYWQSATKRTISERSYF